MAIIGVGKIGEGIARALLNAGFKYVVGTVRTQRRARALSNLGIQILLDNREAVSRSDVVFLCVKPGQVKGVITEIVDLVGGGKRLVISVAAAVSTSYIEALAPGIRVIRAMPNIGILAGYSVTAICPGKNASEQDVEVAKSLFGTMGFCTLVEEEHMDAITAYSGSGPAYILLFYEALVLAGLKVGLPRELAKELALHTMIGAAKLIEKVDAHPAEIRDMVITPGGVTIDAIHVLESRGFKAIIMDAVNEAYRKSKVISRELENRR